MMNKNKYFKINDNSSLIRVGTWNKGGWNTRLEEKVNEIEVMAKENNLAVLGISEANFGKDDDPKNVEIQGYNLVWDLGHENQERKNARSVIYIRKDLGFKVRWDLMNMNVPEVWLEIQVMNRRRFLFCQIYREFTPWGGGEEGRRLKQQEERLEEWLEKVADTIQAGREIWIVGDLNLDLSRKCDPSYDRRKMAKNFHDKIIGRGMKQIITDPTHKQGEGRASIIDLILTSDGKKVENWGNVETGTSHDLVWTDINYKSVVRTRQVRRRTWKNFSIVRLHQEAEKVDWRYEGIVQENESELNKRVEDLENKVRKVMDKVAPIKVIEDNPMRICWMTEDLRQRRIYRDLKKNQLERGASSAEWKEWKRKRNRLNKDMKKAKELYLVRKIGDKLENSGTMWRGVKDFLGWKDGGAPEMLSANGILVKDPPLIAKEMDDAFANKLHEVEKEVGEPDGNYLETIRNMTRGNCSCFGFRQVTEEDVERKVREVPDKPSMGFDDISYGVLKRMISWIKEPLTNIMNLSLRVRRYPEEWRVAIIKPLYKGGGKDALEARSYRPVSLLSSCSRIMEGLLAEQMNQYAEREELLFPGTHGFRSGMSPNTALIEIQSHILDELEAGNLVSICLLDVSAGFDTVSHTYLLRKLEVIGYNEETIEWIQSYLERRVQMVQIEASKSQGRIVKKGIPQGGPMSPPLFREYSNDIPVSLYKGSLLWKTGELEDRSREENTRREGFKENILTQQIKLKPREERDPEEEWDLWLVENNNKVEKWIEERTGIGPSKPVVPEDVNTTARATIYADDTSARESAKTTAELAVKTEKMLETLIDAMRESRLLVNAGKTKMILCATRQKRQRHELEDFCIKVEGKEIKSELSGTLLGVELSNDYTWKHQVRKVSEECAKRFGGIMKVSHLLNFKQRKELVEGSIISKIRFCLEVVSSGTETDMKTLMGIQSRAARIILKQGRIGWSRTEGFRKLGWLTVPQMAIEMSIRTMIKILKNKKPKNIYRELVEVRDHEEQVKILEEREIDRKTKLSRRSWKIRCLRYYKVLPSYLKTGDPMKKEWKTNLKRWVEENIPPDGDGIFKGKREGELDSDSEDEENINNDVAM